MQTDLITKVYFNEHLTHSCVGMPQGLQALSSSFSCYNDKVFNGSKCYFSAIVSLLLIYLFLFIFYILIYSNICVIQYLWLKTYIYIYWPQLLQNAC